jgi:hypothetical protein
LLACWLALTHAVEILSASGSNTAGQCFSARFEEAVSDRANQAISSPQALYVSFPTLRRWNLSDGLVIVDCTFTTVG